MTTSSIAIVVPPAELTHRNLDAFHAAVQPHVQDAAAPGIVLDLENMTFVNSAGLGAIVQLGKTLGEQDRRLALARPTRSVEKLIKVLGLNSMLPVFRGIDDASKHARNG